jgi:hypothetical protein
MPAWRDAVRDRLITTIDPEDRIWFLIMPMAGYLFEAGAGIAAALRLDERCLSLAPAMGMLLMIGIHNAWDITVWTVMRRRE